MRKKIFIIDNNTATLFGLQAKFSTEGMDVFFPKNTEEADCIIRELHVCKPDYLILNKCLNKGLEFLRQIKSNEGFFDIPIFVFSNSMENDWQEKYKNLGVDYVLNSDLNMDDLVFKIKRIISNKEKKFINYEKD